MDIIIIILLLVLIAEVTYMVAVASKRLDGKRVRQQMFVDTSVLIDGRITAVAKSGFLSDTLVIPRSVIGELQLLADNADGEKRTRARHGLDVVAELQAMEEVTVEIFPDSSRAEEGVDDRLLKLAKQYNGTLCTIDYNLNKVAQVEGIKVVNVNDLSKGLRMAYLPGEKLKITLTSKGNDSNQAVGHLEDGTMVVVEQAKGKIGSAVDIEVIRSLQTAAGRMMFARLIDTTGGRGKKKQVTQQLPATDKNDQKKQAPLTNAKIAKQPVRGRQKQSNAADNGNNSTKSPKNNKRSSKSNEDRLIELVNRQD